MSPSTQRLSSDELHRRIRLLIALGVPAQNIKVHPDCEFGISSALVDKRKAEWGFKILGAYVGTDEFVMNALQQKMESIRKITQTLLLYPNVQARYYLHRFCYNSKVNYWLRTQFPSHVAPFVQDFKESQARLIASYHRLHDVNDFNFNADQAKIILPPLTFNRQPCNFTTTLSF